MNKKLGMMALTGALALVACSQGGSNGGGGSTNHNLTITFSGGVTSAPITITNSAGTVVDSETVSSGFKKSLAAGTYTVTAQPVTGYNPTTATSQTANLNTADATLNFAYTATTGGGGGTLPVANAVNLISIKDENNVALPFQQEINDNKIATLFSAQTEESVCVIAKVVASDGTAVANSKVSIATTYTGTVDIADGCLANVTSQTVKSQAGDTATVTTDANGFARFRVFATYGNVSNFNTADPAKFVISAQDASGNQLTPLEIKGFFLNMSHLYVGEATTVPAAGAPVTIDPTTAYQTKTRTGDSTGYVNVFGTQANPANIAAFNVFAYQKQPQTTPQYLPTGTFQGANTSYIAPGYVEYDLSGTDAANFQFVDSGDGNDAYSTDPNFGNTAPFGPIPTSATAGTYAYSNTAVSYRDYGNNNGVQIEPRSGVTVPTDRPLNVTVKATYVFETAYGTDTTGATRFYDFPLKDVTINKTYQSSFLTINKTVDNHVLTWAGPEITMAATGEEQAEPLIANYTITVTNTSQTPAYNVAVKDSLPPELGVALPTDQLTNIGGVGGTYDTTLHQITWNYTTTPALANIPAGGSVTLKFPVYARQKPGFQYTDATGAYNNYAIKPRIPAAAAPYNPYPDPYLTRNGANGPADVTVAFFPTNTNNLQNQVVTDFTPPDDRADVWVVRPEFTLTKTLLSQNPSQVGASNFYQIALRQINQTSNGGLYAAIAAKYPYEFTKTSTATTAGDSARANPYGVNVKLSDAFDYGLDFTNATAFNVYENNAATTNSTVPVSGGGTATVIGGTPYITEPTTPTTGRSFGWSPVPLFEGDDVGAAQVALTSSVSSPNAPGDPTTPDPARPNGWLNCAYLNNYAGTSVQGTYNLNQPSAGSALYQTSIYFANPAQYPAPWAPNTVGQTEIGNADYTGTFLATGKNADGSGIYNTGLVSPQSGLESCASVVVVANQTSALTFTNRGEYQGAGEPSGNIIPANAKDGYAIGQTFYYKFDSQNTGNADANGVNVTFTTNNSNVIFPAGGTYQAYVGTAGGTFTPVAGPSGLGTVSADGSTVTFTGLTVPAGQFVRLVLTGQAQFSGTTQVNGTLTYQPAGQAQVILNTQEVTTVNQ